MKKRLSAIGIIAAASLPAPVLACSTCFGDPESPMAKGAVAGVMVLAGVVGFVLVSIATTSVYFVYRGRSAARVDIPAADSPAADQQRL